MSTSKCPHCAIGLEMKKTEGGVVYACKQCSGVSVGWGLLKRKMEPAVVQNIWQSASREGKAGTATCPTCPSPMSVVSVKLASGPVDIDVCTHCHHVWFDKAELEKLAKGPTKPIDPGRPAQKPVVPLGGMADPRPGYYDSTSYNAIDLALDALDVYFTFWK